MQNGIEKSIDIDQSFYQKSVGIGIDIVFSVSVPYMILGAQK